MKLKTIIIALFEVLGKIWLLEIWYGLPAISLAACSLLI